MIFIVTKAERKDTGETAMEWNVSPGFYKRMESFIWIEFRYIINIKENIWLLIG